MTDFGISDRQLDLAATLLQTLHLSVAARAELPAAGMPFSALLRAAQRELSLYGHLPASIAPDEDFSGVVLELRNNAYWVHEQHESGVARFGDKSARPAKDLADAVRAYLRVNGGSSIGGVRIDTAS